MTMQEGPPCAAPYSVLVVDDYPDAAAACGELLALHGFDVSVAESSHAALARLDGWEPDVAVLDLRMPGLDGYELARWLRVRGDACPVLVAVTGLTSGACRERAMAVGFDHFLVKPVEPDVLVRLLGTYAAARSGSAWPRSALRVSPRDGLRHCPARQRSEPLSRS
jgi:CheY-like chemotaxis protein